MSRLVAYFFRGLVLLAPVAITVYVCFWLFTFVDGWLGLPIPGAGFLATLALITLVGFLGSTLLSRGAVSIFDRVLARLPFVNLVYKSTRDLVTAFVGEKRRFDKPVMVQLFMDSHAHVLGFVTQESLERLGQDGMASVYVPQSYNWAGQLFLFPANRVTRLDVLSAAVMAFVISGGVTEIPGPTNASAPSGTRA
jgi:uncharacterized membrane protein